MLELDVIPEHGLTSEQIQFILGTHFSTAIAYIQNQVGVIKGVEISYCDRDPLAYDLLVKLTNDGIKLIFDSLSQRLKVIEVYDLSLVRLKYCDLLFNCPDVSPTIEQIDQSFGATRPGVYDPDKKLFTLTFRGLAFEFPAETSFQPSYGGSRRELGRLQFPPGASPSVSNMVIYAGNSQAECRAPPLPPSHLPTLLCKSLQVIRSGKRTCGISLRLEPSGDLRSGYNQRTSAVIRKIGFGDSVQDVMSAIGAPSRVFYKSEDKMKIHSPNAHRKTASLKSDYFYNYFQLGLDILMDARSNTVKKFILHTNFPGHYNFNMYHRCEFQLELRGGGGDRSSCSSIAPPVAPTAPVSEGDRSTSALDGSRRTPSGDLLTIITPLSKWESVSGVLGPYDRPVVLNRASSTNTTNPFGSTFCYGYQDIIFEVMPAGHLASVSLYLPQGMAPLPINHGEIVDL